MRTVILVLKVLKRKLKKIVNSISIFLIVGCSYYSMAGSIPANINNVYIPLIENDTNNDIVNINIEKLIEIRTMARNSKMYEISDNIRDLLVTHGIEIEDKDGITIWKKSN